MASTINCGNKKNDSKIVVIGGGTGTFVVLYGLKKYFSNLTAVVSMADSGGSNRVIRDEFGLLPTSDIRQCFVALAAGGSESQKIMRSLFTYRFSKGVGFKGMTFGNLFMAALADILGSQTEAIKKTGEVLRICGRVIPVTLNDVELTAKYEDGDIIKSEHYIDEPPERHDSTKKIVDFWTEPQAFICPEAKKEILSADLIILGPGDLYTSLLANVIIKGVASSIKKSKAKLVFVINLMTKLGQTYGFSASDHVKEFRKYVGRYPDYILINKKQIPGAVKKHYWILEKSQPVQDDLDFGKSIKVIRQDFLSSRIYSKDKGDVLKRSLVRHDSAKLAKAITDLVK